VIYRKIIKYEKDIQSHPQGEKMRVRIKGYYN
jgi:hypothetical protein